MKKMLIVFTLIGVLLLSGCKAKENEVDLSKPSIQINGSEEMFVAFGGVYTDPGAIVIGDFNVVITTSGVVDTNTFGEYSILYSLDYEGETISTTRRVIVVSQTEKDFNILLGYVSKTENSLSFAIAVDDDNGNLRNSVAGLYKGTVLLEEFYFGNGNTLLTFDGLEPNVYYELKLSGIYNEGTDIYTLNDHTFGIYTLKLDEVEDKVIALNGDEFMTVVKDGEFTDPGAYVVDNADITVEAISNLDVTTPGNYHIIYSAGERDEMIFSFRQITVVEAVNEISIIMNGEPEMNINLYESFVDPGSYIVGYSGNVAKMPTPLSSVNINVPGQYEVVYSVTIEDVTYKATRIVNVLPVWAINGLFMSGEPVLTVELGDAFFDPGAFYAGNENVEIVVVSTVDVNTEGHYQIEYSAVLGLVTLDTVSRNVNVVDSTPETVQVHLNGAADMTINKDETFVDPGAFYTGSTVARIIAVDSTLDETTVGDYTITYSIVLNDIRYEAVRTVHVIEVVVLAPSLTMTSSVIGIETFSADITVTDPSSKITHMKLTIYDVIQDYKVSEELLSVGDNTVLFQYLQSENQYKVVIEYGYIEDGNMFPTDMEDIVLTFTTNAIPSPTITSSLCKADDDEIKCWFEFDETGFDNDTTYFAQLELNGNVPQVEYIDDGEIYFEYGILNNQNYNVRLYATATVTATGERYTARIGEYSTPTGDLLAAPMITELVQFIEPNKITLEFDLVDTDNTFESGYVYIGSEQIPIVLGYNLIVFETNIAANDDYYIGYRVNYDDGDVWDYENFKTIYSVTVMTPPVIGLESFDGDGMFFTGDTIVLEILLDNFIEYDVDSVTINGVVKDVFNFPRNNESIYVNMETGSVGDYTYNLDSVNVTVNEVTYSYEYDQSLSLHVYNVGEIDPDYATVNPVKYTTGLTDGSVFVIVPEDDEDEKFIDFYIHLDNKYNLLVTGLGMMPNTDTYPTVTDFDIISSTLIKVRTQVGEGDNLKGLYYIDFEINGVTVRKDLTKNGEIVNFSTIYGYKTSESHSISTVADFLAMDVGDDGPGYYYLINDIDFLGIDIPSIGSSGGNYYGYFNGNGYTLSNFNIIKNTNETSTSDDYIGLFGLASGFFADFTVSNAHIDLVVGGNDNIPHVGIVFGSFRGNIVNVHVINSTISVTGVEVGDIGGLVGSLSESWYDIIENSSANVDITVVSDELAPEDQYSLNVGGLIGFNDESDIHSSYSKGTITLTNSNPLYQDVYTGGLVGYMVNGGGYYDKPAYMFDSYSGVDIISSGRYTGGLLGGTSEAFSEAAWLENVFAYGDIISTHPRGNTGGLVGYFNGDIYNGFSTSMIDVDFGGGYLIGQDSTYNQYGFHNSYYWDQQTILRDGELRQSLERYWEMERGFVASSDEFNSADFYINVLGYSPLMFDFDSLIVTADILPTLK